MGYIYRVGYGRRRGLGIGIEIDRGYPVFDLRLSCR
jgi:hypothetical protein